MLRRGAEVAVFGFSGGSQIPALGETGCLLLGGVVGGFAGAWEGEEGQKRTSQDVEDEKIRSHAFEKRSKNRQEQLKTRWSDLQKQSDRISKKLETVDEDRSSRKEHFNRKLNDLSWEKDRSMELVERLKEWDKKWRPRLAVMIEE